MLFGGGRGLRWNECVWKREGGEPDPACVDRSDNALTSTVVISIAVSCRAVLCAHFELSCSSCSSSSPARLSIATDTEGSLTATVDLCGAPANL
ncbi:hypothetical protein NL676_025122 [Syzygium grande]|nr:hypothetical protein NL676_025122 [Syzygium grande]